MLPHRFELSTQTIGGWISDQIKEILIGGVFGFIVIEVIYAVLRAAPETWWLWAAAIMLLFSVVLANLSPILIMPLFYKVVPLGEEYADLSARLMRLAERAHTKVRGVYKFDMSRRTKAANAALMGLGNTRRIVLGDTLLSRIQRRRNRNGAGARVGPSRQQRHSCRHCRRDGFHRDRVVDRFGGHELGRDGVWLHQSR